MKQQELILAWTEALKGIPKKDQKAWIVKTLRSKRNLPIFGRYFFPHIIQGVVPDCHFDLIAELSKPKDSGIIFPRGFAKSTWEKIDTIHDIVYAIEPVIVYVSATLQDAGFHFESMKAEFENNQGLRFIYGNLVPDMKSRESVKWTNTHFETLNNVNVVARGANKGRGVNIKNRRPTKIIVDDAETDEQVRSPMRRQKYHDWLYNVIVPSLDKRRGRIKVIGTVIHPECEVLKFYKAKGGIFRKAIENEKSIWPTYWTLRDLKKLRDGYTNLKGNFIEGIGTRAFMQEYMNEPTNEELARIRPEWIDDNLYTVLPLSKARLHKVITIDPQSGESDQSDEYAITVIAWYTGDRHRYVLEQKAGRASQMQQAIEVIRMWLAHPEASVVGIEKVRSQVAVFQTLMEWRAGRLQLDGIEVVSRNIPLQAIAPSGSVAAKERKGMDKVARFEIHEPMIERGELHIRPEMKLLREQILFIGTGTLDHDDRVDSMIMGLDLSFQTANGTNRLAGLTGKSKTTAGNLWKEKF